MQAIREKRIVLWKDRYLARKVRCMADAPVSLKLTAGLYCQEGDSYSERASTTTISEPYFLFLSVKKFSYKNIELFLRKPEDLSVLETASCMAVMDK